MSQSSSTSSSTRNCRRRSPPPRLGWPAAVAAPPAADGADDDGADDGLIAPNNNNKRPRRVTFVQKKQPPTSSSSHHRIPKRQQQQLLLWTEQYAPKSFSELAVAPKKVKEVASWLKSDNNDSNNANASSCNMLILVGGPGVGKSAMIQCLAREQGRSVQEWTESYMGGMPNTNGFSSFNNNSSLEHLKPIDSLQQFLQQTATGFSSLLTVENSSKNRAALLENGTRNNASSSSSKKTSNSSLILLDELPHLHGPEAEERCADILTRHIQQTAVKTVLIYSDTVEGKARPDALEKLIHPNTLYSHSHCRIIQIHAPTKARFGKVMQKIAAAERMSAIDVEELYARSNGDLRFAITTLQYESAGSGNRSMCNGPRNKKVKTGNSDTTIQSQRDTKLSSFHALGKLLYAKRQKTESQNGATGNGERPALQFDPERVVEQSEMELSSVLHFLGYHSPDFFTDNGELSACFDLFSDAALLLDLQQPQQQQSLQFSCAASLAGRAVAHSNRHPAAHRFRQFSAPAVFDVMRKRRENAVRLQRIARVDADTEQNPSLALSASNFAVDVWPFQRTIQPEASFRLKLNSYFDAVSKRQAASRQEEDEAEMAVMMKEQEEILRLDDIVDGKEGE